MESIGLILGNANKVGRLALRPRTALTAVLLKSCRGTLLPTPGSELISNGGSIRLAAQEGRDIENLFLDRAAYGSGATERIEALRCRRPRMFRDRPCRPHFGVAGHRKHRRRTGELLRRYTALDPLSGAAPVVAQPAGEVRQ